MDLQVASGNLSGWVWEGCARATGTSQAGMAGPRAGLVLRQCSVAGAEATGRRALEWPVPSPLPQADIPAPGTPKAPLLGTAWHCPARDTLGSFSCRPPG